MQLVGYSFVSESPPLGQGHLRLCGYSAVVGANDVGKSTLLRLVHHELERGRAPRSGFDPHARVAYPHGGLFFVETTEVEADLTVWLATSDLRARAAGTTDDALHADARSFG